MNPETAGRVFHAARDEFALWSARLWRPLGELLTAVSRPAPGERVFDACCGAGASALPAAHAVGPGGVVDAVDAAAGLVADAARQAEAAGLTQARFHTGDVLTWDGGAEPYDGYDLVQCGYGVFFFPDMDAGARALLRRLRPGGRFAVSSWLAGGMDRIVPVGHAAAVPERPELAQGQRPSASDRLNSEDRVRSWLLSLGLVDVEVHTVDYRFSLHPDDAWTFYLGAALRGFVQGLPPEALERVRARFEAGLREADLGTLDASSLLARGRLPG
ncbi:class I SAM-dependent methyltransferase [Saccharomonospora piscinae]|uniref:class I SAM-dependent methyltransferase n=1 Tax=Saccharomonospora piscinae TaxID=687388 RepID=UPI000466F199|nr:methyltransferase domain-containing protein [Saccharomonospora piscinae]